MDTLATTARTILAETHLLPVEVVAAVRLEKAEGLDGDSGVITVGYVNAAGRRKITAQTVTPSLDDAFALLADRDRAAGLIALGVRSMPPSFRPVLPEWVSGSVEVARFDAMRTRAKGVAQAAIARDADLPRAA